MPANIDTQSEKVEAADQPVLKIGFLCDLTGQNLWYGSIMKDMGIATVNVMNEEGIEGFSKIEATIYDTNSNQQTACEKMKQAKQDGMNAVWGSWVEAQLIPYDNKFVQIPYVMNNPTGVKSLTDDNKWVINPCGTSWDIGLATADFFRLNNVKTYAITGQGWGEGWLDGWAEGIKYGIKSYNIQCVWDQEVPSTKTDWTKEIEIWKQLKPDAIVFPNPGEGAYTVIRQMKENGYSPRFIIMDPMSGGDYSVINKELGTSNMVGLYAPTNSDVDSPGWKEFATQHLKMNYLPYGYSAEIWDTLHLIKVAAEKVGYSGVQDPNIFVESLKSSSYNGAMGHMLGPFRENGLLQNVDIYFLQCVSKAPDWTDRVDFHWQTIFKIAYSPQMSYNEISNEWPDLSKRIALETP
jgi:ABC-type branched-subunit amino acid transport system substrate-binding protein